MELANFHKLIPTNGLWYKIKKFFKSLFFKEKLCTVNEINTIEEEQKSNNSIYDDNLKEKFEKENKKKALAENCFMKN